MPDNPLHRLVADALGAWGGRPVVTFYDHATGERVELSAVTLDNWVAKTANLLRDAVAVAPGDTVAVTLPPHWQTVVVVLACWRVGTTVVPLDPVQPLSAAALVADETRLAAAVRAARVTGSEVIGLSLAPMGRGLREHPAEVVDYASEVLAHGDRCPAVAPWVAALNDSDNGRESYAETLATLREAARGAGVSGGDRTLVTYGTAASDAGVTVARLVPLLAPLAAGATLVLVRHYSGDVPGGLDRLVAAERITVRWPT